MMTTIGGVQYREVNRKAEVGETILIKKAFGTGGFYGVGAVLTVKRTDGEKLFVNENPRPIHIAEYVVLEPITSADTIVHNGTQYRKVDRPVREGDAFIVPKESLLDYTAGKVYSILLISPAGYPHFIDDVGDRFHVYHGDYYVLEPITPSLVTLESELAATKAKVAEMEAQLAEVKRAEAEAQRLKVGDYVKIVSTDAALAGFDVGDIAEIKEPVGGRYLHTVVNLRKRTRGYCDDRHVTRATDEEVAEAKRKLAFDQFAKGDKVRLVSGGGDYPLYGFKDGEIYEVYSPRHEHDHGTKVQIVRADGKCGFANPDQLVKLTEVELAEIERKKAEEAKWSAIGRKVGEFKKGDVVKITRYQCGHAEGSIVTVTNVYETSMDVRGIRNDSLITYGADNRCVELIAPVESVVNLRGGDAA